MASKIKAFNCEVCGSKTLIEDDEPYECSNGCAATEKKGGKKKEKPAVEPAKTTEDTVANPPESGDASGKEPATE